VGSEYIHTNVFIKQSSKNHGVPCGDVVEIYRDDISTTLVLCDGLGSGLKANIYATMVCSRIITLIKNGQSVRSAFHIVGETMNSAWGKELPFAVFTIARILSNGNTLVLTYDMPSPFIVTKNYAEVLKGKVYTWSKAIIQETVCVLKKNEGLVLVSDGITQAGLGQGLANGWEIDGVARYVSSKLPNSDLNYEDIACQIHDKAKELWKKIKGDDCSVIFAQNNKGVTVNILTGPPENKEDDYIQVNSFMRAEGLKIICGGSTSQMLSRIAKKTMEVEENKSFISLPTYKIKGIMLATEGVITLNQVCNILYHNVDVKNEESPVYELVEYLKIADKVVFFVGLANNLSNDNLVLTQQGIQNRYEVVNLIADYLREEQKLVLVKKY